jgi:hypothetical protein
MCCRESSKLVDAVDWLEREWGVRIGSGGGGGGSLEGGGGWGSSKGGGGGEAKVEEG